MPTERIDLTAAREAASVITDTRRTRPRFFDGKFLTAADLMLEQNYLLTRQADVARTLGFGIVAGLRTTRSPVSASALPNPAASVAISAGHGLTPAGEIVFLPRDLVVDLDNVPQMQRLNAAFGLSRQPQQPFNTLSGLFVVGLRAVEFTANPTPTYPPSVDGNNALRDGEIIEATAVTLVPYDSDATRMAPDIARARVAREVFLDQRPPPLPASVLPLAMIYLRNGALEWVDEWLVRREAGDDDRFGFGFAPRALAEAHFFHYRERLAGLPATGNTLLAAKDYFEILPPAGPLPGDALNRADFTQGFFPPEARVELAVVPEDELAALLEESMDLPPLDLSLKPEDNDALALLVLAPVSRATFGDVASQLAGSRPLLRSPAPSRLGQQRPLEALLKLNAVFAAKQQRESGTEAEATTDEMDASFTDAAWTSVLSKVPQLWFVRRRNLPESAGLASQPLGVTSTDTDPSTGDTSDEDSPPGSGGDVPGGSGLPTSEEEATLAKALATEGLWGRFAFLRAVSDVRAHRALVRVLATPLVLRNPVLQQALFTALEKAIKVISESPLENFEQIQKDPGLRVLTEAIVLKVARELARPEIVRGLETVFKDHPRALTDKRMRAVLGRTNKLGALAKLGTDFASSPELPKLAERVEKYASAGRAQGVSDTVDRTLKKLRA
jgi:hypothetical protein